MSEKSNTKYYAPYRFFKYLAYISWPASLFIVSTYSTFKDMDIDESLQNYIPGIGVLLSILFFVIRWYYLAKLEASYIQSLSCSISVKPQKSLETISKRSILVTDTSETSLHYQEKNNNVLFTRLWAQYFSEGNKPAIWTVYMDTVVVSFRLPAHFPHTFIDGKGQNMLTPKSNDLWVLKSKLKDVNRKLDPEGQFPKDFSVYSAVEHDSDVLRILTPDVMEAIKELGRNIDIEIIDDQVNIIIDRKVMRTQSIAKTANSIDRLMKELLFELKRSHNNWKNELVLSTSTLQLPLMQFAYIALYSRLILFMVGMFVIFVSVLAGAITGELLSIIF